MAAAAEKLKVHVVEDETDLRDEIVEALSEAGFKVEGFPGSRELYASLLRSPCDIAILDVGLPGEDGFSIAAHLHRLDAAIGIIMLTAHAQTEDRVRALLGGADTYLTKPVDLRELVAAIHSLARRLKSRRVAAVGNATDWTLSDDGWTLTSPKKVAMHLSAQERLFLQCLYHRTGEAVSRDSLVEALGEDPYDYDLHRLDTLVNRLRRKAANAGMTLPLRAVRGQGYVFTAVSGENRK